MATLMDWISGSFFNGIGIAVGINLFLPMVQRMEIFGDAYIIHNIIASMVSGLFGLFSLNLFTSYLAI